MESQFNDKKVVWSWTMYDWANSVFSLTIATAIFPPYYESITQHAAIANGAPSGGPYRIPFLGFNIDAAALYSYALSLGFLLVTLSTPLLSGIADYKGNKKSFMKFFCYLGSLACICMYFFTESSIPWGVLMFVLSLFGFGGSLVFYNAYLPEIASEDQFDRISARGFSMGYIGSVLLLIINLVTIMFPQWFFPVSDMAEGLIQTGKSAEEALSSAKGHYVGIASRLSFVTVGLWWMGFAQIPFRFLPNGTKASGGDQQSLILKGWNELKKVFREVQTNETHNHLKRFLLGFFFSSMGVQTVLYVASLFGSVELKLPTQDLIITVLIIQLIAILGAWMFARISGRIGNIYTLLIMLFVWISVCVVAYFIQTPVEFYMLGAVVGLVMGGIQSLFRSTYAKLIPEQTTDHASYFSFYDVTEKLSIVLGTFSYGLLQAFTGNMRASIIALIVFFIIGLFFMVRIKNFKTFV